MHFKRRRQTTLISKHQCNTFGITWNVHHYMSPLLLCSSVSIAFLQLCVKLEIFSWHNIYILKFCIDISDVSTGQIT